MTRPLRVAVVGAGMGGLAAAAHLAGRGCEVTVFEAGPSVGGKAGRIAREGFVFDTGPTVLTMPEVLRRAFSAVGGDLDRDVPLAPIDPLTRYFFAPARLGEAHSRLDVFRDGARTAREVERVFSGEGEAYPRFLSWAERVWSFAGGPYLDAPFDRAGGLAARMLSGGLGSLRTGATLGTLDSTAKRFFSRPEMHAFVNRFATYAGGDPARTSGAFAMIAHLELTLGAVHPRGGMHAIALALAERLRARGVVLRTSAPVERVRVERHRGLARATGVRVAGETSFERFDAVVLNVDPQLAYERLLPAEVGEREGLAALAGRERSVSGYALLLGVEGPIDPIAHHTVLFPRAYPAEFRALFRDARVPDEPTVYVCAPSLSEPDRAPAGSHALFVLVNAPATGDDPRAFDEAQCAAIDRAVLASLDAVVPGLSSRVRVRERVTPRDIAALGSPGGAIYGEAPHGLTAPFRRPRQRCASVEGLYFVGGSVHPGGGVPLVTLGGEHAATLVLGDAPALRRAREFSTPSSESVRAQ